MLCKDRWSRSSTKGLSRLHSNLTACSERQGRLVFISYKKNHHEHQHQHQHHQKTDYRGTREASWKIAWAFQWNINNMPDSFNCYTITANITGFVFAWSCFLRLSYAFGVRKINEGRWSVKFNYAPGENPCTHTQISASMFVTDEVVLLSPRQFYSLGDRINSHLQPKTKITTWWVTINLQTPGLCLKIQDWWSHHTHS